MPTILTTCRDLLGRPRSSRSRISTLWWAGDHSVSDSRSNNTSMISSGVASMTISRDSVTAMALDHLVFRQPAHYRPPDEHRKPAGQHPVQQYRRHGDGRGQSERRQTTDQRRFDRADASGRGCGGGEGSADHRHDGNRDERRVTAEGFDARPQGQRCTESRSGAAEYDQRQPLGFAGEFGEVADDLLEPGPHRRPEPQPQPGYEQERADQ